VAVRRAIAVAFEREAGFEVVGQASSLAQARTMRSGVDVAVLDLGLPDGDGAELIAELRDRSPGVLTLVLSSSLDPAATARAVEKGAAVVLDKTAQLDEVVETVKRLSADRQTSA
jgi:DNA-binding NarL/FixJ family response regulator